MLKKLLPKFVNELVNGFLLLCNVHINYFCDFFDIINDLLLTAAASFYILTINNLNSKSVLKGTCIYVYI